MANLKFDSRSATSSSYTARYESLFVGLGNIFSISDFLPTSPRRALWICPDCNGEYLYPINERQIGDDSCPYCSGKKLLRGYNDMATKHPELMDEWCEVDNGLLGIWPDEITEKFTTPVWWACKECGYKYPMTISDRLYLKMRKKKSCPRCKGYRRMRTYYG